MYDTVLEETGDGTMFERTIGRIRFVESAGLVASALAGGLLAEAVPLRATYLLTAPFIVAAGLALLRFREPRLHRPDDAESLRHQVAATYRALLERGAVRPIVALLVLTALPVAGHVGGRSPVAGGPGGLRWDLRPALGRPDGGAGLAGCWGVAWSCADRSPPRSSPARSSAAAPS